jgi:tetratricopeptide (TPR) repeat protein
MNRYTLALGILCGMTGAAIAVDPPQRFDGLGPHTRKVTTENAECLAFFNQGLNFLFAFNHDEAIRSFARATELDPKCAMAWWGLATANGPHINNPMVPPERGKAGFAAAAKAQALAVAGTPAEKALAAAAVARFADPPPEDRTKLDQAYAVAMRAAWKQFPHDADVGALCAEAIMDLRPWDLWGPDRLPRPDTPEILSTLEAVLKLNPAHPLAAHLYIHACEASPEPGKADAASDQLRTLTPGLGHLVHMPSHIDIRRGRWKEAIDANARAIAADAKYAAKAPAPQFYRLYMAHNRHMLAFAAAMAGEGQRALDSVRQMAAEMPPAWLADPMNAMIADGFLGLPAEILVRFGRWDEVLKEPEPPANFPIARASRHANRAIAFSALGKPAEARATQKAFREALNAVPKEAQMGNNLAREVFAVTDLSLEGELLAREGKPADGAVALKKAVELEDKLKYDEPPDRFVPARHALGVVLLAAGDAAGAEAAYREDLVRWPENGWALAGLSKSLAAQGKSGPAADAAAHAAKVWARADLPPKTSCLCLQSEK